MLYVYPGVPPPAVAVSVVVPPLHKIVPADAEAVTAVGSVTVTLVEAVHQLTSVTMTV